MLNFFRYQGHKEYFGRQIAIALQCALLLAVWINGVVPRHQVLAQSKPAGAERSPLCTPDNALAMIQQQVDLTKTFDDPVRRITVLIRAADLLWPYQQDKARASFTEAFELATEIEKENDARGTRSIILRLQKPDQRYVVVRAVSKRDPAFAKKLTGKILKQNDDQGSSTRDSFNDVLTAEKLRYSAY